MNQELLLRTTQNNLASSLRSCQHALHQQEQASYDELKLAVFREFADIMLSKLLWKAPEASTASAAHRLGRRSCEIKIRRQNLIQAAYSTHPIVTKLTILSDIACIVRSIMYYHR